ncbi:MAG: type II secretion system protein [Rhodoferax sp.]|nr:type II secretion system protein [Rhodoferax sp.]
MKQVQRGFTLIELVMVIVILGVLAAVAIPKFFDLSADARQAAVQGVAGALSSGSAINYAMYTAKGTAGGAQTITSCDDVKKTLQGSAYPASGGVYSVKEKDAFKDAQAIAGASSTCTLQLEPPNGAVVTATFTAIAAP